MKSSRLPEPAVKRSELAAFLRMKRHQLLPEQVGLPNHTPRRVVGLRREEVAQLAAVGLTWYTWLEQGREIQVSPQVLQGISRALRLSEEEKTYLYALAHVPLPEITGELITEVDANLIILIDALAVPAYIINQRWDILAANKLLLAQWSETEDSLRKESNFMRKLFLDTTLSSMIKDWEVVGPNTVALFRATTARHIGYPWFNTLIAELEEKSTDFRRWWRDQHIQVAHSQPRTLHYPTGEIFTGTIHILNFIQHPDLHLIVTIPVDKQSIVFYKQVITQK